MKWGWALILLLLIAYPSYSLSVGVAPGVINFGEVQPGGRYIGKSYLLTLSNDKILVDLLFKQPHLKWMLEPNADVEYDITQASEEDISSWIKFPRNPELIDPAFKTLIKLKNGQTIAANKEMTFYIDIPEDAEPGYHMGAIVPSPRTTAGSGIGVSTIAVSTVVFTFRVPGEVIKDIEPIAVEARRTSDREVYLDVLIKNKGTVTARSRIKSLKVFDSDGNILAVLNSGWTTVSPDETKIITLIWNSRNPIKSEEYTAKITVEWYRGEKSATTTFSVPEKITVSKPKPPKKCFRFPLWMMVAIAIVSLGIVSVVGYTPALLTIGLGLIAAWKFISCGEIEVWVILLAALNYMYERLMG